MVVGRIGRSSARLASGILLEDVLVHLVFIRALLMFLSLHVSYTLRFILRFVFFLGHLPSGHCVLNALVKPGSNGTETHVHRHAG